MCPSFEGRWGQDNVPLLATVLRKSFIALDEECECEFRRKRLRACILTFNLFIPLKRTVYSAIRRESKHSLPNVSIAHVFPIWRAPFRRIGFLSGASFHCLKASMMSRSILTTFDGIVRNFVKLLHFSVLSNAKIRILFHSTKHFLFYFHKVERIGWVKQNSACF